MNDEGLADVEAANPFRFPDFTQELVPDAGSRVDLRGADAAQRLSSGYTA